MVEVDEGDGAGAREVARDGAEPTGPGGPGEASEVRLPTTAPLRGVLRVRHAPGRGPDRGEERDLTELIAHRVAMAVESQWLRGVDQRRRSWMTYLAETSELLGQSLDVDLTVAVVPQVVVPRLGLWCAVHLVDDAGRLRLAGLTHADENQLPELREALDVGPVRRAAGAAGRAARERRAPVRFAVPTDGVAVALTARGRTLGTLTVGRPATRAHTPEDVVLVGDIARRAALAIHNAQSTAAHVATSQALQQAKSTTTFLLQRAGIPTPRHFAPRRSRRGGSDRVRAPRRGPKAGAEAAIRGARQRLAPDRFARRSLLAGGGERGLLSPGVRRAGARAPSGLAALRLPGPRDRRNDQARFELDHQYQARRPRQGRHREPGAGRSCAARHGLRRRRLCRGGHHPGARRPLHVLEVNSMPAWNGLQRVSRIRISDHLVDAFLDAALPPARREGQEGT